MCEFGVCVCVFYTGVMSNLTYGLWFLLKAPNRGISGFKICTISILNWFGCTIVRNILQTQDTVTSITFKNVGFWCEVKSNRQRDHQDSEEKQRLQGWNQGAFVSAEECKSSMWYNTASLLMPGNGAHAEYLAIDYWHEIKVICSCWHVLSITQEASKGLLEVKLFSVYKLGSNWSSDAS